MTRLAPLRFAELKAGGRLPSPSGPALRLIELLARDTTALSEIVREVQQDPALTGRILKLANASAFARPRPAVAITVDVLMTIGLPALRQWVLACALIDGYRSGLCKALDYPAFWSRAIARGAAAQTLGAALRLAPPAELYTLGLVADVGLLGLASIEPERFGPILAQTGPTRAERLAAEQDAFGFDERGLAIALLRDWGFPALFVEAVERALYPPAEPTAVAPRAQRLAWLLALADRLAALIDLDDPARRAHLQPLLDEARRLDLDAQRFLALADDSLTAWREWSAVFALPTYTLTPFSTLAMTTEEPPQSGQRPLRVLVVDDDSALRRLLEHQLGKAGYQVRTAADGRQGLHEALAWRPDILLTDLLMPHQDGFELIRKLRASELGQSLYCIVLSVVDDEGPMSEAFALGADDYLAKPLKPRTLLARLDAGARIVRLQKTLAERNLALNQALRQVEAQASTDALTGLPNRRYIEARLAQECAAAARSGRALSWLLLDIDHLRRVNDTYGQAVGDAVLVEVARRIQHTKRRSDVAARLGGGSFAIIAVDTPPPAARQLAERLRRAVAAADVAVGGKNIPVTVSIGLAGYTAGGGTIDALRQAAEDALERAKAQGCNRVDCQAQPSA
ncbi:hypothetical protein C3497_00760 [Zoogloeaceae bacteirum Par-f-2]|nr:hypothetical protein C3497_00760 [Zoogloeaceae bacteirum Par-f-2]